MHDDGWACTQLIMYIVKKLIYNFYNTKVWWLYGRY